LRPVARGSVGGDGMSSPASSMRCPNNARSLLSQASQASLRSVGHSFMSDEGPSSPGGHSVSKTVFFKDAHTFTNTATARALHSAAAESHHAHRVGS
ncbi:unnamed protein product, partial [Polarella glacialis]